MPPCAPPHARSRSGGSMSRPSTARSRPLRLDACGRGPAFCATAPPATGSLLLASMLLPTSAGLGNGNTNRTGGAALGGATPRGSPHSAREASEGGGVRSGHDAPAPTSSGFETSSESESEPEEEEVDKPRWAAATAHRGTGRRPASASGTSRKESLPTPQPWGRRTSDRLSSAGTCRACSRARTPACRRTGRPCAGTGAATPCLRGQWPARQGGGSTPPPGSIKTKTS